MAYHWNRYTSASLLQLGRHLDDGLPDLADRGAEATLLGAQLRQLLVAGRQLRGADDRYQDSGDRADGAEHERADDPVGDAGRRRPGDEGLEDEQRDVGQRDPEAGEEALGEEALGQLGRREPVGDERPVGLHRGVVADVEEPQQQHGHPEGGDEREQEQADAAADRPDDEERLPPPPSRAPRPVRKRADQRLDEQPGDRPGQVEERQVVGVGAEIVVDRVHGGLLHAEAVLDPEEPQVHQQDLPHVHQRLLPHDGGVRLRRRLLPRDGAVRGRLSRAAHRGISFARWPARWASSRFSSSSQPRLW